MSKIVKSTQSCSMAIFSIIVYFILLSARSMHDVTCEFTCAVTMRSSNERELP